MMMMMKMTKDGKDKYVQLQYDDLVGKKVDWDDG